MTDLRIDQLLVAAPIPALVGGSAVPSESFADVLMTDAAPQAVTTPVPGAQILMQSPASPEGTEAPASNALKLKRHLLVAEDDEAALAALAARQWSTSAETPPAEPSLAADAVAAPAAPFAITPAIATDAQTARIAPTTDAFDAAAVALGREAAPPAAANGDAAAAPIVPNSAVDAAPAAVNGDSHAAPVALDGNVDAAPAALDGDVDAAPAAAIARSSEPAIRPTSEQTVGVPTTAPLASDARPQPPASQASSAPVSAQAAAATGADDGAVPSLPASAEPAVAVGADPTAAPTQIQAQAAALPAEQPVRLAARGETAAPATTIAPGEAARRGQSGQTARQPSPGATADTAGTETNAPKAQTAAAAASAPATAAAPQLSAETAETLEPALPTELDADAASSEITQDVGDVAAQTRPGSASAETRAPGQTHAAATERVARGDLVSTIKTTVEGGVREFSISLDPENLGRVDVRVEIDEQGQVDIHITADSADAIDVLEEDRDLLEASLESLGEEVDLGSLTFSLNDGSSDGGQPERPPARAGKYVNLAVLTNVAAIEADTLGRMGLHVMARDRVDLYT